MSKWQVWVFEGEIIIAEVAIKAVDQSMVERRSNSFLEKKSDMQPVFREENQMIVRVGAKSRLLSAILITK